MAVIRQTLKNTTTSVKVKLKMNMLAEYNRTKTNFAEEKDKEIQKYCINKKRVGCRHRENVIRVKSTDCILKKIWYRYKKMEPVVGFEPTTGCLQNSCSTTELNWLLNDNTIQCILDYASEI